MEATSWLKSRCKFAQRSMRLSRIRGTALTRMENGLRREPAGFVAYARIYAPAGNRLE